MYYPSTQDRLKGAAGAGLLVALILYTLLAGLVVRLPGMPEPGLPLFDLSPTPPPVPPKPRVESQPSQAKRKAGEAAPPNLRSKATEVTASPITPVIPPPQTVVAATKPFEGSQSTQGSAPVAGPGTGAGGIGNGTGAGGYGDGDGGGGDGEGTAPRFRSGRFKRSDVPEQIWMDIRGEATVGIRYFVNIDGRVSNCRVSKSSGNAYLDALTCRLIEERYRYKPSLDPDGRPVRSIVYHDYTWINTLYGGRDPDDDGGDDR